jgi:hypothetical protein
MWIKLIDVIRASIPFLKHVSSFNLYATYRLYYVLTYYTNIMYYAMLCVVERSVYLMIYATAR